MIGLPNAIGVAVMMVPAGIFVVSKEISKGLGDVAYSSLQGVIISGFIILTLAISGIVFRNQSDYIRDVYFLLQS
ncbi:hypothetical protein [Pollutibacter soli]|uniref:hypothetical protein n=1 Tax=Pollutibacter soli TaxID=3034157 RepID=UPI003013A3CD